MSASSMVQIHRAQSKDYSRFLTSYRTHGSDAKSTQTRGSDQSSTRLQQLYQLRKS